MKVSFIILAAGQGTRMRSAVPKVLHTLAGKPLLQHVVDCALAAGADEVCVVHGHGGEVVKAAFAGQPIRWVHQAEQLGTGHAAQLATAGTPEANRVLILFGDVPLLEPSTLRRLLETGNEGDLALLTVDMDDPTGYGRIVRDNGRLVRIVEQKDASPAEQAITEINTGVLRAPAGKLKQWLSRLDSNNSQGEYYLTDVIAMAVAEGVAVHGVKAGDWKEVMGINDRKQLAEAERALQQRRVEALMEQGVGFADPARVDIRGTLTCGTDVFIDANVVFEGEVTLGDNVTVESCNLVRDSSFGAGTVIHPHCHIEKAVTGAKCEIGPFARLRPGAELEDKVKIGNFVEVKKSTIAHGSKVNHLSYIGDTTIGTGVNVGAGTITCNYDGANKYRTVIGDNAFIGSGVELVAPVEIGAGATIGAGSTITKPAPAEELTVARARQVTIEGWKKPVKKPA
ncbi:MAG TPA: bifunctional UDP-N-acetylglucosamine diphosphorylase/glucosamine-1-phosphate N-acetyltransferase GlmU [Woeseiaceae bacterium]|nr:bifunctional UDP-N-acetylglucosamine diphosphorylase/glucosamine-1-phosphate N-acetyltransferase GlmU [Woeseiaceae bacterium]